LHLSCPRDTAVLPLHVLKPSRRQALSSSPLSTVGRPLPSDHCTCCSSMNQSKLRAPALPKRLGHSTSNAEMDSEDRDSHFVDCSVHSLQDWLSHLVEAPWILNEWNIINKCRKAGTRTGSQITHSPCDSDCPQLQIFSLPASLLACSILLSLLPSPSAGLCLTHITSV
jgi:hypothetical protein